MAEESVRKDERGLIGARIRLGRWDWLPPVDPVPFEKNLLRGGQRGAVSHRLMKLARS